MITNFSKVLDFQPVISQTQLAHLKLAVSPPRSLHCTYFGSLGVKLIIAPIGIPK